MKTLKEIWNEEADQYNTWDSLGLDEKIAFMVLMRFPLLNPEKVSLDETDLKILEERKKLYSILRKELGIDIGEFGYRVFGAEDYI